MCNPNRTAYTAYRYARLGLIPFAGLLFGPLALVCGIVGLNREKDHPTVQGTARAKFGIVLGALELLTNWLGLLFMLIGLGVLAVS